MASKSSARTDFIAIVHLLVLLQGAILVTGVLEAIVFSACLGPPRCRQPSLPAWRPR